MAKDKKDKAERTRRAGAGRTPAQPEPQQVWRRHAVGLRQQAVERIELGCNISALGRELGIRRSLLYYWWDRHKQSQAGAAAAERRGASARVAQLEGRIASLEGSLGRKTEELDFFVSALRRVEGRRQSSGNTGGTASTAKSESGRQRRKAD